GEGSVVEYDAAAALPGIVFGTDDPGLQHRLQAAVFAAAIGDAQYGLEGGAVDAVGGARTLAAGGGDEEGHGIVAAPGGVVDYLLYLSLNAGAFQVDWRVFRAPLLWRPGNGAGLGAAGKVLPSAEGGGIAGI